MIQLYWLHCNSSIANQLGGLKVQWSFKVLFLNASSRDSPTLSLLCIWKWPTGVNLINLMQHVEVRDPPWRRRHAWFSTAQQQLFVMIAAQQVAALLLLLLFEMRCRPHDAGSLHCWLFDQACGSTSQKILIIKWGHHVVPGAQHCFLYCAVAFSSPKTAFKCKWVSF